MDQPNRVSVAYVAPKDPIFQELYGLLRDRRALEKIQEILSPFRLPEELTIKTAECGVVNSWYTRENFKPTVTICYEYLKHILESLPNETSPPGSHRPMQQRGSSSGLLYTRSDTQYSTFLMCQYLDMRKMPPIILQRTSYCNLARGRRGD